MNTDDVVFGVHPLGYRISLVLNTILNNSTKVDSCANDPIHNTLYSHECRIDGRRWDWRYHKRTNERTNEAKSVCQRWLDAFDDDAVWIMEKVSFLCCCHYLILLYTYYLCDSNSFCACKTVTLFICWINLQVISESLCFQCTLQERIDNISSLTSLKWYFPTKYKRSNRFFLNGSHSRKQF